MKKMICFVLCIVLSFLCGCTPVKKQERLSVVATVFPYYDFATQIAGGNAKVTMLLSPGGEVHGYEPTLNDMVLIEQCDVFLYNGGEGDAWVESLLANCDLSQKRVVRLMDMVELLTVGEEHHHEGHHHEVEEADEHIFTTPENALKIATAIENAMKDADPSHEEQYQENGAELQQELTALSQEYEVLQGAKKPLVVADRFPFLYLTTRYGLSHFAAFSGCSSNSEADLKTVYELKTALQKADTKAVLCTEFSDKRLATTLANAVGGTVYVWHSCHNVTKEEWENKVTYVEIMKRNLGVLKEVLTL